MKTPILIAIIAAALHVIASLYYLLLNLRILEYSNLNKGINNLMQVFFFLSGVGFLVFFILFYDKESRK
jgi:hypothetical protein